MSIDFNCLVTNATQQATRDSQAMLGELDSAMRQLQRNQARNRARYSDWRGRAAQTLPPTDSGCGMMLENLLFGFIMQSLFGLPGLHGLGVSPDMAQGLGVAGAEYHRDVSGNTYHPLDRAQNNALIAATTHVLADTHVDNTKRINQLGDGKKQIIALLLALLTEGEAGESGGSTGEGRGGDLVPDVLRHPKLARFKQNRHSLSCVRSQFQHQAEAIADHSVVKFPVPRVA